MQIVKKMLIKRHGRIRRTTEFIQLVQRPQCVLVCRVSVKKLMLN